MTVEVKEEGVVGGGLDVDSLVGGGAAKELAVSEFDG